MAIKINDQDLQARYINWNSIGKVMLNGGQIRPATIPPTPPAEEYIEYRVNAYSSFGSYWCLVPVWWVWHDGNDYTTHDRYISVDWWEPTRDNTHTWWFTKKVTTSWVHTIKITPVVATYWRALAYSWRNVGSSYIWNLRGIVYDASYMWYAESATNTWDYFRAEQYKWCYNIASAPAEVLPNTVTTIWNYFRSQQYAWCSGIWTQPNEVMPDSVTSIGTYFRTEQYKQSWILATKNEVLSSNITTIPDYFRYGQFASCSNISSTGNESLPSWVTTIWDEFRFNQFYMCSNLTTTSPEALPSTVTTIWDYFREQQYAWCSSISNISSWRDLSVWWSYYRDNQFANCTASKTITVATDVWFPMYIYQESSTYTGWIDAATQVNVPNAYLTNFQTTQNTPWKLVYPTSKFIWY